MEIERVHTGVDLEAQVRMQGLLLEQISREMDLMTEVLMAFDMKLEWLEDGMDARFGEAECRFEAALEEIEALRRAIVRFARARIRPRLRRLGEPSPS